MALDITEYINQQKSYLFFLFSAPPVRPLFLCVTTYMCTLCIYPCGGCYSAHQSAPKEAPFVAVFCIYCRALFALRHRPFPSNLRDDLPRPTWKYCAWSQNTNAEFSILTRHIRSTNCKQQQAGTRQKKPMMSENERERKREVSTKEIELIFCLIPEYYSRGNEN